MFCNYEGEQEGAISYSFGKGMGKEEEEERKKRIFQRKIKM